MRADLGCVHSPRPRPRLRPRAHPVTAGWFGFMVFEC